MRDFNFHSRLIVRRSLQAAFWLIAGLKLTKNSPLLLRADRGRNVYPRKSKLEQWPSSLRFESLQ